MNLLATLGDQQPAVVTLITVVEDLYLMLTQSPVATSATIVSMLSLYALVRKRTKRRP